jgi:Na+-transporting methylmalonyl-CoA/oxaloacetate decarboxylase gamma subunit
MTFLNVVIAILSFIYFLYYLYSAIVSPAKQAYYQEQVEQFSKEQDQKLTNAATAAAVATTKPKAVYV